MIIGVTGGVVLLGVGVPVSKRGVTLTTKRGVVSGSLLTTGVCRADYAGIVTVFIIRHDDIAVCLVDGLVSLPNGFTEASANAAIVSPTTLVTRFVDLVGGVISPTGLVGVTGV